MWRSSDGDVTAYLADTGVEEVLVRHQLHVEDEKVDISIDVQHP
jgi:hypothetical protein